MSTNISQIAKSAADLLQSIGLKFTIETPCGEVFSGEASAEVQEDEPVKEKPTRKRRDDVKILCNEIIKELDAVGKAKVIETHDKDAGWIKVLHNKMAFMSRQAWGNNRARATIVNGVNITFTRVEA